MIVYLNKYRTHWISPYVILKTVCFWEKDEDKIYNLTDDPNNKYQKWVDILQPVCEGLQKFLDIIHPKIDYVKIDYFDTWNMDTTLAKIALPMLKQLKEKKHGSQNVDLEDVPEELRCTSHEEWEDQKTFDFYHEHDPQEGQCDVHARWDWVLNEMIFAFESKFNDWEEKYYSGKTDYKSVPCEWDDQGNPTLFEMKTGPNHTHKFDAEGYGEERARIQNGFRLFGKYYEGLWD